MPPPIVVVGAGHNGLVAGCYLARAGRDVLVLEARDTPGGGARTEETVAGYRFDMHSVAHTMINMTTIPDELDLAGAGTNPSGGILGTPGRAAGPARGWWACRS